jgi:hypothetical protein
MCSHLYATTQSPPIEVWPVERDDTLTPRSAQQLNMSYLEKSRQANIASGNLKPVSTTHKPTAAIAGQPLPPGHGLVNSHFASLCGSFDREENNHATYQPVNNWKAKRSPHSLKAQKHVRAFYGTEEDCWADGWRWTFIEDQNPPFHS